VGTDAAGPQGQIVSAHLIVLDNGSVDAVVRLTSANSSNETQVWHLEPAVRYPGVRERRDLLAHQRHVLYARRHVLESMWGPQAPQASFCGHRDVRHETSRWEQASPQLQDGLEEAWQRRSAPELGATIPCPGPCTCPMGLIADHRYFQAVGGSDVAYTASLMVQAITDVNIIYRQSAFRNKVGYGLSIATVTVYEGTSGGNPVPKSYYTADEFLEAFSKPDGRCLVHLFTHYDFAGILGLAWVGSTNGAAGICDTSGHNTGWTSTLTFGSRMPSAVTMVVLSHECVCCCASPAPPLRAPAPQRWACLTHVLARRAGLDTTMALSTTLKGRARLVAAQATLSCRLDTIACTPQAAGSGGSSSHLSRCGGYRTGTRKLPTGTSPTTTSFLPAPSIRLVPCWKRKPASATATALPCAVRSCPACHASATSPLAAPSRGNRRAQHRLPGHGQ
jgi:hypothetical protein